MEKDSRKVSRKELVDKIFNRLRAQLYNMLEQMGLEEKKFESYKQQVKDITSSAWNNVSKLDSEEK